MGSNWCITMGRLATLTFDTTSQAYISKRLIIPPKSHFSEMKQPLYLLRSSISNVSSCNRFLLEMGTKPLRLKEGKLTLLPDKHVNNPTTLLAIAYLLVFHRRVSCQGGSLIGACISQIRCFFAVESISLPGHSLQQTCMFFSPFIETNRKQCWYFHESNTFFSRSSPAMPGQLVLSSSFHASRPSSSHASRLTTKRDDVSVSRPQIDLTFRKQSPLK